MCFHRGKGIDGGGVRWGGCEGVEKQLCKQSPLAESGSLKCSGFLLAEL